MPTQRELRMAKDDRKQATRKRILEVAVEHFARYGFDTATVDAIANEAGVAAPTIYFHFKTKPGLYAEAVTVAGERFLASMQNQSATCLHALAERWIAALTSDTETTRVVRSLAGDGRHPPVTRAAFTLNGAFVDFWCGWLRKRDGGRAHRNEARRLLASMIVATLTGVVAANLAGDNAVVVFCLNSLAQSVAAFERGEGVSRC